MTKRMIIIMMMMIIKNNNHRMIIRETRVTAASATTITGRNPIGLDLSSCGINPQIHLKNR
jgi:hypothetical protein